MYRFARVSCPVSILIALLSCTVTGTAQDGPYFATCPACEQHLGGDSRSGPYATRGECQDWINKYESTFPYSCSLAGASSGGTGWLTPQAAVIGSTVVFGAAGALVGSFPTAPGGQNFVAGGGLLGGGAFGLTALAINAHSLSKPAVVAGSTLLGAATGAGAAVGYTFHQQLDNINVPSPTVVKDAAMGGGIGAAAGAALGFILPHLAGGAKSQSTNPFIRKLGGVQLGMMHQGVSMHFAW